MTDPIYGDPPIDVVIEWSEGMWPALLVDPEILAWRATITDAITELVDSAWSVQWRCKSPATAIGIHLDAFGEGLEQPRPDGWDDDRYRPVVVALDGSTPGRRVVDTTIAIANALVFGSQAWELLEADPHTYVVFFFELPTAEAATYLAILDRGRPKGFRMILAYSEQPKAGAFVLDESDLDGPDVLLQIA